VLLAVLDVERHLERRRLARGDQDSLRMLDPKLAPLGRRARSVESDGDRVGFVVVGHVREDVPLGRELIADVAPDDLDRRLDRPQHLGQLVEVRAPGVAWDLRGDSGHRPSS
jgi:hypothetical protein